MLNKLQSFLKQYRMVNCADTVICAVSGGADSMALLWGMYLLREKLNIRLEAAHFNHHLRGSESDGDEAFVREFCQRFEIPLHVGSAQVMTGEKGLEAAARNARYAFFETLSGKIATAHTADDNAETVLMHLIRGTGLKGLGGIAPVRENFIRPLLSVTRQEVRAFLCEYHISFRQDSSNDEDAFLRNRLRHHVMPLLKAENPSLAENVSAMAQRLRQEEDCLAAQAKEADTLNVNELRALHGALRNRVIEDFLKSAGVREPEARHIALTEALIFSDNPSAKADLPGGICVGRCYSQLTVLNEKPPIIPAELLCPGVTEFPQLGLRLVCVEAEQGIIPKGQLILRGRCAGDAITLPGGTKNLKKLFIDRKIPAWQRSQIPVIADDRGILAVQGLGMNRKYLENGGFEIHFEEINKEEI